MTMGYVPLGPTPSDESCAYVGEDDYIDRARAECQRYITLLRRTFGPEPDGAKLQIKWFPHDFGEYAEVICSFDSNMPEAVDYAYRCDAEAPTTWDTDDSPGPEKVPPCPECSNALEPGGTFSTTAMTAGNGYLCRTCKVIFTHDLQFLARFV